MCYLFLFEPSQIELVIFIFLPIVCLWWFMYSLRQTIFSLPDFSLYPESSLAESLMHVLLLKHIQGHLSFYEHALENSSASLCPIPTTLWYLLIFVTSVPHLRWKYSNIVFVREINYSNWKSGHIKTVELNQYAEKCWLFKFLSLNIQYILKSIWLP